MVEAPVGSTRQWCQVLRVFIAAYSQSKWKFAQDDSKLHRMPTLFKFNPQAQRSLSSVSSPRVAEPRSAQLSFEPSLGQSDFPSEQRRWTSCKHSQQRALRMSEGQWLSGQTCLLPSLEPQLHGLLTLTHTHNGDVTKQERAWHCKEITDSVGHQ